MLFYLNQYLQFIFYLVKLKNKRFRNKFWIKCKRKKSVDQAAFYLRVDHQRDLVKIRFSQEEKEQKVSVLETRFSKDQKWRRRNQARKQRAFRVYLYLCVEEPRNSGSVSSIASNRCWWWNPSWGRRGEEQRRKFKKDRDSWYSGKLGLSVRFLIFKKDRDSWYSTKLVRKINRVDVNG